VGPQSEFLVRLAKDSALELASGSVWPVQGYALESAWPSVVGSQSEFLVRLAKDSALELASGSV
jgi:hypothetical protein